MVVLGAHVKVSAQRYLVGFARIDELTLVGVDSFAAPADLEEAGQLAELLVRTEGVIAEADPDLFILKVSEIRNSGHAALARRAEGVVLAAAGRLDSLPVAVRTRQKLANYAGTSRNANLVKNLCGELDRVPAAVECREAAAAAVGGLKEA